MNDDDDDDDDDNDDVNNDGDGDDDDCSLYLEQWTGGPCFIWWVVSVEEKPYSGNEERDVLLSGGVRSATDCGRKIISLSV